MSYEELQKIINDPNHPLMKNSLSREALLKAYQGLQAGQRYGDAQSQIQDRYSQITDFKSPLYQNYRSYLEKSSPQLGADQMIAPLLAGGGAYGGSQKIAQERSQAYNSQRNDAISKGVQEFALGNQGQATGLLGLYSSNQNFKMQLDQNQKQFDEANDASFGNQLLGLGGGLLSTFLPLPTFGGNAGKSSPSGPAKPSYGY